MSAVVRNIIEETRAAELREKQRVKENDVIMNKDVDVTNALLTALSKNKEKVINWRDAESGNSMLHTLAYSNSSSQIKILLENGFDIEAMNNFGETALHWAIKTNSLESVILLLDNNANINAKDLSNSTPLHYATMIGTPEMVSLLLRRGADHSCRDNDGKSAFDISLEGEGEEFLAIKVLLHRSKNDQNNKKITLKPINNNALLSLQSIAYSADEKQQKLKPKPDIERSKSEKNIKLNSSQKTNDNMQTTNYISKLQRTESEPMMITIPLSILQEKNIDIKEFLPPTTTKKKKPLHEPNVRYLSSSALDKIRTLRMMKKTKPPGPVFAIRGIFRPLNEKYIDNNPPEDHFNFNTTLVVKDRAKIVAFAPALLGLPTIQNPNLDPANTADFSKMEGKVSANIQYMFTDPSYIPYLPLSPTHGDIYISIEHCCDCEQHGYCLWHDEDRYNSCAEHYLVQLIKLIYKKAPPVRVHAYKVKPDRCRIGAFEITISAWVDQNNHGQWIVNTIFSKLHSLTWPTDSAVLRAMELFLNIFIKEYSPSLLKVENMQLLAEASESINRWGQKLFERGDLVANPRPVSLKKVNSKGSNKGSNKNVLQVAEVVENVDPFLPLEKNSLHPLAPEKLLEWDKLNLPKYFVCDLIDRKSITATLSTNELHRIRSQSLEGSIEKDDNDEETEVEGDGSLFGIKSESLTNLEL